MCANTACRITTAQRGNTNQEFVHEKNGYTDLMVDGASSPHQPDTTLRWLIDRPRS